MSFESASVRMAVFDQKKDARGMRTFLMLAALCACQTPYQPMGVTGGYQEELLPNGDYVVTVKVNGYTDRATALKYLHRRAGELCPDGFEMRDRAEGDNGSVRHDIHKAEEDAVVRCKHDEPVAEKASAPMPRKRVEGDRPIVTGAKPVFCTIDKNDSDVGLCFLVESECTAERERQGEDFLECAVRANSACFNANATLDARRITVCAPSVKNCEARRREKANDPDFTNVGERCGIYRAKAQQPTGEPVKQSSDTEEP